MTDGADVRAYDEARAAGDVEAMASAALRLAGSRIFGTVPGRLPAFLYEAYSLAEGEQRAALAVAIARAWVYGGSPERAEAFADEALTAAEAMANPPLLAQALDAQLLVRWGPDDFDERLAITARLEDTVAHVPDVEARMSAYLWRLTTALECLDVAVIRRQLRALEHLAEETNEPRVRFFAASRRAMHALLVGDVDLARRAHREAVIAGETAGEADAFAIDHALTTSIARQSGDIDVMAAEAALAQEFGEQEGVLSVSAIAAQLWASLGEVDRATQLLRELAGSDFAHIPRDVDWLFTMTMLTEVAAQVRHRNLCEHAIALLTPYAGRGVVDAGAVGFAGVVDHYVAQAVDVVGNDDGQQWWAQARDCYGRLGASWWLQRCTGTAQTSRPDDVFFRLIAGDSWEIGRDGSVAVVRAMKGFHYLRLLLQRPGLDVFSLDLSNAVAGHPGVGVNETPLDAPLDRAAAAAYRHRLDEIDDELDEVRSWGDAERVVRLEDEREALVSELRAAAGLGDRARTTGGTSDKARIAVRKAIAAAMTKVAEVDPSLGRLLKDTIVTGATCRYDPDPDRPTTWLLD